MVSDLYLLCLPVSHKKDARLIWVNSQVSFGTNPCIHMAIHMLLKTQICYTHSGPLHLTTADGFIVLIFGLALESEC